ncbi:MAG: YrdB family protein [Thermomicrobiales bacterium]
MANSPVNLGFRFLLEVIAISALAFWGWAWGGWVRWPLGIGIALAAMAVWAIFRTPGDGTSGPGLVAIPGPVRLLLELAMFGLAVLALFNAHASPRAETVGTILGIAVVIHYALSWDRIIWLLKTR